MIGVYSLTGFFLQIFSGTVITLMEEREVIGFEKILEIWWYGRICDEYLLKSRWGREQGGQIVAKVRDLCSSGGRTPSLRTNLGVGFVIGEQSLSIVTKLVLIVLLTLRNLYEVKLLSSCLRIIVFLFQ